LAIVEIVLILFVLLLYIATDARTVKMIADQSLASTKLTYKSIEGNFITGLEIKDLAYDRDTLVSSATLHWNPISLIYKKITLTQVDAKGVDIDNIMKMIDGFEKKKKSSSSFSLPISLSMEHIHLDINPYVYAGVKLDSFLFETDKIEIDKEMLIDADNLYLYFNSDIVNVELMGNIDKSKVSLTNVNLKEIGSREIAYFVREMRKINKNKKDDNNVSKSIEKKSEPILKEIKVDHIFATMKDVTYGPFSMNAVKLYIDDAEFDTYNKYTYKAKKVTFKGDTTFGSVKYKGYIKESNIYAKGGLLLSKKLFSMYHLPLNYKNLRKLPGTLHLNHKGVWIDVEHKVKNLLDIKADFNIDVTKAKHSVAYVYRDKKVIIDSKLKANMSYGDNANIESRVLVDIAKRGYTVYSGKVDVPKVKNLPTELTDYLIRDLKAEYKGDKDGLVVKVDSKLIDGTFTTNGYKSAVLKLKSKEKNISLKKMVSAIPKELDGELVALDSESFFDFKSINNSTVTLKIDSNIVDAEAKMKLIKPYKISFTGVVPSNSRLSLLNKGLKLQQIRNISGDVLMEDGLYTVHIKDNNDLALSLKYNSKTKQMSNGEVLFAGEEIKFSNTNGEDIALKLNVNNLNKLLSTVEKYYDITFPKLKGKVDVTLTKNKDGLLKFSIKSPILKYVTDSELDIEKVDLKFTLDTNGNIVIDEYYFRVDNNPYFKDYYANNPSYLNFKNGKLTIKKLWLNNKAVINGSYNLKHSHGDFYLSAKKFPFENRDFDLLLNIDTKLIINGKKLEVDGEVNILGNSIHYDIEGSSIVEDSDIIIVQEQKKSKESALNNLKLYLKIKSEKPLKYYGKDTNIEFYNELRVIKEYSTDFMVTGMSTVTNGYYELEDKRFTLNESHLYFAGDPKKPLLDIKANYVKDEYTIHIFISGSVDEPIVNFNAEPYLTQQEILSLILFDGTGSSSGQGAEAYTLLGGTFAKGLIKSLGIDVDHLLLGTNADDELSLEVGRKVSDDITFMYMYENGENGAKVRVEHSKKFETDIIIMPSASSIELLYRQDR
jgi:hypothetical protein